MNARPATPATDWRRRCGAALPWIVLVAALGLLFAQRTIENLGEYDRYPDMAEAICRGELPFDRFHPMVYPLAAAAVMTVTGIDAFSACLLLSAIMAVVMVRAGATVAERLRPGARRLATWVLATNAVVWSMAMTASADITGAALLMAGIALASHLGASRSRWRALAIGALLGGACAVHSSLLPIVVAAAAVTGLSSRDLRWSGVLITGLVIGYLPHLVTATLAGYPPLGDSWHSMYLKVRCDYDTTRLQDAYDDGSLPSLWQFLADDWRLIFGRAAADGLFAVSRSLPFMLLAPLPALLPVAIPLAAVALAALPLLSRRRIAGMLVAALALAQTAFISLTFNPLPRLLLPSLAVLLIGLGIAAAALRQRGRRAGIVAAALVTAIAACGGFRVRQFLASEPSAEVAVARALPPLTSQPIVALATYQLLNRHVDYPALAFRRAQVKNGEQAWQAVKKQMSRHGASVILIGRVTAAELFAAIVDAPVPGDFRVLHRDADTFAAERTVPKSNWVTAVEAGPEPIRSGQPCQLTARLTDEAEADSIAQVGIAAVGPDGGRHLLPLEPLGDGAYRCEHAFATAGRWRLQAIVLRSTGQVLRGVEHELVVVE
ncbi:MAG: hypothetical protein KDC98_09605 [Planctomycetes bacterium]|nr:hypothetical protein [Planctomycetota bacterium]